MLNPSSFIETLLGSIEDHSVVQHMGTRKNKDGRQVELWVPKHPGQVEVVVRITQKSKPSHGVGRLILGNAREATSFNHRSQLVTHNGRVVSCQPEGHSISSETLSWVAEFCLKFRVALLD